LSLKKIILSSCNTNGKKSNQLKATKECSIDTNLSAQALPSLKICEQRKKVQAEGNLPIYSIRSMAQYSDSLKPTVPILNHFLSIPALLSISIQIVL
jgi:hypothetical protein